MESFITGYQPVDGAYREMLAADGVIRHHWLPMWIQLNALGAETITSRWKRAQRVIRQNGITYNAFGDPEELNRPWELDPIPLVISPDEWDAISAGLIQRAKLLNLLLADLYGCQQLLKNGTLPSELVFANRTFHRSCCQIRPPDNLYLNMLAVDLARTPSGGWRIVKDHTQTPAGAGYALENRLVVSRTFPTMYRDCRVERLAGFFSKLRERLGDLSPRQDQPPRIVILTPGPESETYFEHAYLARYLSFPLVQGNDLTVRGNKVFHKTLAGLRQVDVILLRQSDSDCDPLELDHTSLLGIPGLVQAAASGEVVVANALGSGLAETPALLPFMPMLCRHLLGEEPLLYSVPTLWCGQTFEMNHVLENLDRWVIKPAFPGTHDDPSFPLQLSPEERGRLADRIRSDPKRYIAQENTSLSIAPCWMEGRLVPRHILMRAFVAATRDGWTVMPGGLVRSSSTPDSTVVTMESGGGSKDAWVLARKEVAMITLLPREGGDVLPPRGEEILSSRIADNLFWLGRYIQRAEFQTRMLRTILRRLTEETFPDGTPELSELLRTLSVMTEQEPQNGVIESPVKEMDLTIQFICDVVYDREHPNNLNQALAQACRIGTIVRDRISVDTWRILDRLDHELHRTTIDMPAMLDELQMTLSAFSGLGFEGMTHGYGWHFMDMGFRMERAMMNALIFRELLTNPAPYEEPVLDAILEIASSSITYRTRYQSNVALLPLLDLLVVDRSNPRGIAFQLEMINEHIRELSNLPRQGQLQEQILATDLVQLVERFDLTLTRITDKTGRRNILADFLTNIMDRVVELSTLITERYLAHVQPTRKLSSLVGGEIPPTEKAR